YAALDGPALRYHVGAAPALDQLALQGRAMGRAMALLHDHVPDMSALEQVWPWQHVEPPEQMSRMHPLPSAEPSPVSACCWLTAGKNPHDTLLLDDTGLVNPGSYRRFVSMTDAHAQYGPCAHVLSNMPDAATWHWLTD